MSYFKVKMHEIHFDCNCAQDPAGEDYSASPDHLAGYNGACFYGERVEEKRKEGKDVNEGKEKGKWRGNGGVRGST